MTTKRSITLDGEIYWAANDVVREIYNIVPASAANRVKMLCRCKINGCFVSKLLSRRHKFVGSGSLTSIINAAEIETLREYLKLTNKVTRRIEKGTKRSVTLDGEIYWAANDIATEIIGNDYHVRPSSGFKVLSQQEIYGPRVSKLLSRKHWFKDSKRPISIINAAEIEEFRKIVINTKKKGCVYAGYSEGNGTKIGMSFKDNPMKRLSDGNTYIRHPYELLDYIQCENPSILENYIHHELGEYKVGGHNRELFDIPHQYLITTFFHYIKKALKGGQDVSKYMVSDAFYKCMQQPRFNS